MTLLENRISKCEIKAAVPIWYAPCGSLTHEGVLDSQSPDVSCLLFRCFHANYETEDVPLKSLSSFQAHVFFSLQWEHYIAA